MPRPLWGKSLAETNPEAWAIIRGEVLASEKKCHICGSTEELEARELYEYDDTDCVQSLRGIHALCLKCNMVQHYGFAEIESGQKLLEERKLTLDDLKAHFMEVNHATLTEWEMHDSIASVIWDIRNRKAWTQDLISTRGIR